MVFILHLPCRRTDRIHATHVSQKRDIETCNMIDACQFESNLQPGNVAHLSPYPLDDSSLGPFDLYHTIEFASLQKARLNASIYLTRHLIPLRRLECFMVEDAVYCLKSLR